MRNLALLLTISALSFLAAGCPREPVIYADNFTGTVSLLDHADSLLSSVIARYRVMGYDNDTIYTYQTNCDSTGYFDIYVGEQRHENILYLEFSCEGYANQAYPVSTANGEIGEIVLAPYEE